MEKKNTTHGKYLWVHWLFYRLERFICVPIVRQRRIQRQDPSYQGVALVIRKDSMVLKKEPMSRLDQCCYLDGMPSSVFNPQEKRNIER